MVASGSDSTAFQPTGLLVAVAVVMFLIVAVQNLGAQDPPVAPTPTPAPQDEPQDPVPGDETESSDEQESENSEDDWQEDEGPAHTAHGPFDADSIEAEPLKLKWSNFVLVRKSRFLAISASDSEWPCSGTARVEAVHALFNALRISSAAAVGVVRRSRTAFSRTVSISATCGCSRTADRRPSSTSDHIQPSN